MNTPDPDRTANPGLLRPPLIYLVATVSGLLADLLWPWSVPGGVGVKALGVGILIAAIALLVATLKTFRKAATPFPGNQPVRNLIADGPFRFSRNPAYVAFSAITLGIALTLGSFWIMLTLALAIALMNQVVIPREERYLKTLFGERYDDYVQQVRRWI